MRPEEVIDKGKLRAKPSDIRWWCLRKSFKVLRYKPRRDKYWKWRDNIQLIRFIKERTH